MKTYYVYILRCSDNTYYTGVTNNIDRRIIEHQEGYNTTSYTYNRRPIKLVFTEEFNDINNAIAFEKQLKKWSKKKKEALIVQNWKRLKDLSKCMNETNFKNYKME